jgi:hypothetical protein
MFNILFSDAHDLINQWVTDKIRLDMDDDFYNYVDVKEMNNFFSNEKFLTQLKTELLADDVDDNSGDVLDIKGVDYDKYDDNYVTSDILNKIMKKDIIDKKKLLVMAEEKKSKATLNTQLKIEMRQQAVKENREKRLKELEDKRRERLEKKEIELKARQIVLKEEQEKNIRDQIEKQLIEQEANRLRIEMIQQRQREEELRKK